MCKHKRLISCLLALAAVFVIQTVCAFADYTPTAWQQSLVEAQTLAAEGEYAQAEAITSSLLQSASQLPADYVARCYIARGMARDGQNNFDGALSDYRQAMLSTTNESLLFDAYDKATQMFYDEAQYETWYKYFSDIPSPENADQSREMLLAEYQSLRATAPDMSSILSSKQQSAEILHKIRQQHVNALSGLTETYQYTNSSSEYPNVTIQYGVGGTGIQIIESGNSGYDYYLYILDKPIISAEITSGNALHCTVPKGTKLLDYSYYTTSDNAYIKEDYLEYEYPYFDLDEGPDFWTNYGGGYISFSTTGSSGGLSSYTGSSSSGTTPNITVGDVIDAVEYADKLSRGVVDVPQTMEYISLLM